MSSDHIAELSDLQEKLISLQSEKEKLKYENQQYKDEADKLRVSFHKYSSRLGALEHSLLILLEKAGKVNFGSDIATEAMDILEEVRLLLDKTKDEIQSITGICLPLTKNTIIDGMFSYYAYLCQTQNIDFQLRIQGDIQQMIERVVLQKKLEDMIGVHIQNAIHAVVMNDNPFRIIMVHIGMFRGSYGFSVHDAGVPFTPETLSKLGTQRITTRSNAGGNGIGFMTTFRALEEHNASLIVREKEPSSAGFLKSITIQFDGQHRYKIETYRPELFPKSERYEVIKWTQ